MRWRTLLLYLKLTVRRETTNIWPHTLTLYLRVTLTWPWPFGDLWLTLHFDLPSHVLYVLSPVSTTRVDGPSGCIFWHPSTRAITSGVKKCIRVHGPSTRVVETGLYCVNFCMLLPMLYWKTYGSRTRTFLEDYNAGCYQSFGNSVTRTLQFVIVNRVRSTTAYSFNGPCFRRVRVQTLWCYASV